MNKFKTGNLFDLSGFWSLITYLVTSPWIWLGVITLVISLLLYYVAVSRLDLSFVLPILASNYILNALLAWLILDEKVSPLRWIATLVITVGVFIVTINKTRQTRQKFSSAVKNKFKSWVNFGLFALLPFSFSLSPTWSFILIIAVADGFGDLFNAKGMKQIGEVQFESFSHLLEVGKQVITNHWILLGITGQTIAFFSFVSALSLADISFVRPATALTYAISLVGAHFMLKEKIGWGRLVGIIVVGIGIILIDLDKGSSV
ncbi:EamA family transporter [Gloeothece citriformis]|nr:EamA family transporter [Gloeothece citriformis]